MTVLTETLDLNRGTSTFGRVSRSLTEVTREVYVPLDNGTILLKKKHSFNKFLSHSS